MRLKRLLLITGNAGKAKEFEALLAGLELAHQKIDLLEIQSISAQEIGHHKAQQALGLLSPAQQKSFDAVLTDDTSLCFTALGGFPGALVKYCLEALAPTGLARLVEDKAPQADAICQLSLGLVASGEVLQFQGKVAGRIGPPQGDQGFGWDSIFFPDGQDLSYAQMSKEQKKPDQPPPSGRPRPDGLD